DTTPRRGKRLVLVCRHGVHLFHAGRLGVLVRSRAGRAAATARAPASPAAWLYAGIQTAPVCAGGALYPRLDRRAHAAETQPRTARIRLGRPRDAHLGAAGEYLH